MDPESGTSAEIGLSLSPPACERGSRTSPKGKNTAALIRSSASCTLEVALPRAASDRPRLGLGRGATQSEIKLYSVSMRPGLKAGGREAQRRFSRLFLICLRVRSLSFDCFFSSFATYKTLTKKTIQKTKYDHQDNSTPSCHDLSRVRSV